MTLFDPLNAMEYVAVATRITSWPNFSAKLHGWGVENHPSINSKSYPCVPSALFLMHPFIVYNDHKATFLNNMNMFIFIVMFIQGQ
jgi:hypothetical protein